MADHIKHALEAMRIISQSGEKQGVIECPACKGKLHFAVASNGHQRASCETEDCIRYIQ